MSEEAPRQSRSRYFKLGYRAELDGLRAIAVLAVMLLHLGLFLPNGSRVASGGQAGVTLFFVLSGFLITSLLLEEWGGTANINLGAFYLRRILRLFPALIALLITTLLLIYVFVLTPTTFSAPSLRAIPFAAFYLANWDFIHHQTSLGTLVITWSLAVEEQFYIIWPLLLLCLLRQGVRLRRLLKLVLCGVAASTLLRILLLATGSDSYRVLFGSDTRADALLLGCALGIILKSELIIASRYLKFAAPVGITIWIASVVFAPTIIDGVDNHMDYSYLPVFTLTAVAGTLLIGGLVLTHGTLLHRFLANPVLTWIGMRSYGIYLWHVTVYAFAPTFGLIGYPRQLFLVLATLIPVIISYEFVERPALRLKARMRSTITSPAPALVPPTVH
jgi:peptidoglycan/LPS O-acetylase OafA/YrhL